LGSRTEACTPSHVGLELTPVTVAVTGERLSARFQVTLQRPVESVVQVLVVVEPLLSTIRKVTVAPAMAAAVLLWRIRTRTMAL
jgi:hypothetical protein